MKVEVDQSGRLEQLDTDTVIAFANGKSGAVLIKVVTKRQLIQKLKSTVIPHDQLLPLIFSVCLFILLKNVDKRSTLEIDQEYTGKDKVISNALIKLLGNTWSGSIRFKLIGKSSPAHKLAWNIHRSNIKKRGIKKLKLEDILKYI